MWRIDWMPRPQRAGAGGMDSAQRREVGKWGRDLIVSVVLVPAVLAYFQMSPLIMILGGVFSLAVLAVWENWSFIQARRNLKSGVEIACLFIPLFALLGCGYWYSSKHRVAIVMAQPDTSVQQSAEVCVTQNDIDQEAKKGRHLLPLSPREIVDTDLHKGPAAVSIYIGKWVKVCGRFLQVEQDETKTHHIVWVYDQIFNLYFDRDRWESRLANFKDKQDFTAYCEMESFVLGWLHAKNCELVN
jgi:hypothetical protein